MNTTQTESLFVTAARIESNNPGHSVAFRAALAHLLAVAVGQDNAITGDALCNALREKGIALTTHGFQRLVVAHSRRAESGYFIGSSRKGFFLISSQKDVDLMREFYDERITAEEINRSNLLAQAVNAF